MALPHAEDWIWSSEIRVLLSGRGDEEAGLAAATWRSFDGPAVFKADIAADKSKAV